LNRIERFLLPYSSKGTVRLYRNHLKRYFSTFSVVKSLEESAEEYFTQKRVYEDDVVTYFSSIKDWAPLSVGVSMSIVKTFLLENDIEFSSKFWRDLKRKKKGSRALTQDRVPSIEELRGIFSQLPLNGRALFLTLASSGMRIGETLQLKIGDFDFTKDPTHIHIYGEYTKTGNSRLAFISSEATACIKEWLKVRSAWLNKYHVADTGRLFPFNNSASGMFYKAVKRTGLLEKDGSTGRYTIHPHVLRKFFRTQMASVIPVDIVEALMGHEGYLTSAYRRYSEAQLAEFYKQGMHAVSVSNIMKTNDKYVNALAIENVKIRNELDEVKRANEALERMTDLTRQDFLALHELVQTFLAKKFKEEERESLTDEANWRRELEMEMKK